MPLHAIKPPVLLVVDDFYTDPDAIRSFALSQQFTGNKDLYKGKRTQQSWQNPETRARFEELLGLTIPDWSMYGYNGCFQICQAGDTVVYHSDGQTYAGTVYLTPNAPVESGLSLYRSKRTGLRQVTPASVAVAGLDLEQAEKDTYEHNLLDPTAWELVDKVGNVYNRLVLWDGALIHSASCYFGHSEETARLFQQFFFPVQR